jgi:hypothetical protein
VTAQLLATQSAGGAQSTLDAHAWPSLARAAHMPMSEAVAPLQLDAATQTTLSLLHFSPIIAYESGVQTSAGAVGPRLQ